MKPINWHRSIPPLSITGDPEPDFNRTVAAKHGATPGLREAGRARARSRRANRAWSTAKILRELHELRPTAPAHRRCSSGQRPAVSHQPPSIPLHQVGSSAGQATSGSSATPTNRATRSLLPRRITTDVAHRRKPPAQHLQSPFDFGDFGCKTHPQPILNVHQSFH